MNVRTTRMQNLKASDFRTRTRDAAVLVPLDAPFIEGQRYRQAAATEWPSRLDLFTADPAGPWLRLHGLLMAAG